MRRLRFALELVAWAVLAALACLLGTSCAGSTVPASPAWQPVTLGGVVVAKAYVPERSEAQAAAGGGVVVVKRPEVWLLVVSTRSGGLRVGVGVDAFLALHEGNLVVIQGVHRGDLFRAQSIQRVPVGSQPADRWRA